jgi:hypothetical protein
MIESWTPPRHALATLVACSGDLEMAFSIAKSNAKQTALADNSTYWFWAEVRNSLTSEKAAQC